MSATLSENNLRQSSTNVKQEKAEEPEAITLVQPIARHHSLPLPPPSNNLTETREKRQIRRYIITGGPCGGKSSTLLQLEIVKRVQIVEEAAADVISRKIALGEKEPWNQPTFHDDLLELQLLRQDKTNNSEGIIFFDRSPFDILGYCEHFKSTPSVKLLETLVDLKVKKYYEKTVFLLQNLGFTETTEIRHEETPEAILLERLQEKYYSRHGFTVIKIPPASLAERAECIWKKVLKLSAQR